MFNLFSGLVNADRKQTKRFMKEADMAAEAASALKDCPDEELRSRTDLFRKRLAADGDTGPLLCETFAVAGEAVRRTLGIEYSAAGFACGAALCCGTVVRMQPKGNEPPVVLLPVYFSALTGKGVYVVTSGDSAAKEALERLRSVYALLGISAGSVSAEMKPADRKTAYACDVTYVAAGELCLDYLRDNMAESMDGIVLRGLYCAVFADADAVLIDGARMPSVISSEYRQDAGLCIRCDRFVKSLSHTDTEELSAGAESDGDADIVINRTDGTWRFSECGVRKAENAFGLGDYSDPAAFSVRNGIDKAVKANFIAEYGIDYVLENGTVLTVNPFTGGILRGDCFSDGFRQAVAVKEGVPITAENITCALITRQAFFNKFEKKCGITERSGLSEKEFFNMYDMKTVSFPPDRMRKSTVSPKPADSELEDYYGRLRLFEYDLVLDGKRDEIYRRRMEILCCGNIPAFIREMTVSVVSGLAEQELPAQIDGDTDLASVNSALKSIFSVDGPSFAEGTRREYTDTAVDAFCSMAADRRNAGGHGMDADEGIRFMLLAVIDGYWMRFLENAELLKQYAASCLPDSTDPIAWFRAELSGLFDTMDWMILVDSLTNIFCF